MTLEVVYMIPKPTVRRSDADYMRESDLSAG